ncbi:hypothetical protein NQ314_013491 [Rhamnusium bicolor]|uniref:Uncharacterized protein n=1 Tax=Rhamnusium bicolor TaxID=1586634 RepID=A0AAV8X677_9CUCU|nr:hypothetical protein NQ314_013491 [Rhamnusium bicolor]
MAPGCQKRITHGNPQEPKGSKLGKVWDNLWSSLSANDRMTWH